jgi:ethanolamine transporter EutH
MKLIRRFIFMRKNIVFFITLFVLISIVLVISGCTLIFGAQCNEKDPSSTHTFWSVNIGGGFFSEAYCEIGTADPVEDNM